jgi:hypothetical protein
VTLASSVAALSQQLETDAIVTYLFGPIIRLCPPSLSPDAPTAASAVPQTVRETAWQCLISTIEQHDGSLFPLADTAYHVSLLTLRNWLALRAATLQARIPAIRMQHTSGSAPAPGLAPASAALLAAASSTPLPAAEASATADAAEKQKEAEGTIVQQVFTFWTTLNSTEKRHRREQEELGTADSDSDDDEEDAVPAASAGVAGTGAGA